MDAFSAIDRRAPDKMPWDGAYLMSECGVIVKGGPNTQKYVAFLNRA